MWRGRNIARLNAMQAHMHFAIGSLSAVTYDKPIFPEQLNKVSWTKYYIYSDRKGNSWWENVEYVRFGSWVCDGWVSLREVHQDVSLRPGDGQCLVFDLLLGQELTVELLKECTCTLLGEEWIECQHASLRKSYSFWMHLSEECVQHPPHMLWVAYLEEALSNIPANTTPWSSSKREHPASVLCIPTHRRTHHRVKHKVAA